jgi:arylsulfatase A-like enzyme
VPAAERPAPNILFVIVDSARADFMPDRRIGPQHMPFMSKLASEGARFTAVQAPGTWTRLSIPSLLTSTNVGVHGFSDWHLDQRVVESLSPEYTTMAEALRQGGYETAAFALNGPRDGFYAHEFGFARGFDHLGNTAASFEGRTFRDFPHLNRIIDREIMDAALSWIGKRPPSKKPLLFYVHIVGAHDPYDPPPGTPIPEPYRAAVEKMRAGTFQNNEPYAFSTLMLPHESPPQREGLRGLYSATMSYLDGELERLITTVDAKLPDDRPLLTIVTADHGDALYEHEGVYRHGPAVLPYNELTNVPLIVHFPDVVKPRTIDAPAGLVDLYPTVMELAGLKIPVRVQGQSLVPDLLGGRRERLQPLVTEGNSAGPKAVRLGRWKYILVPASEKAPLQEMLFDLGDDPAEKTNLATTRQDRLAQMRRIMEREVLAKSRGVHVRLQPDTDSSFTVKVSAKGGIRRYVSYDLARNVFRPVRPSEKDRSLTVELRVPGGQSAALAFEPIEANDVLALTIDRDGKPLDPTDLTYWPLGNERMTMPMLMPYDRIRRISPDENPSFERAAADVIVYAIGAPTLDRRPMSDETRKRLKALGYLQ